MDYKSEATHRTNVLLEGNIAVVEVGITSLAKDELASSFLITGSASTRGDKEGLRWVDDCHFDRVQVRSGRLLRDLRTVLAATALIITPVPLRAAEDVPVSVELNKLEPQLKACRAYLVIDNPSDAAYGALKLDTFVFRTDGVIDRRLLIDLAPVRPTKKGVKLFDLDGLACDTVGSLLVNGVTECRDAAGPVADCLPRLRFTSRAAAALSK